MKTRLLTIILVLFIFALLNQNSGQAQTIQPKPELIITWQANNFFPSDYAGKAWAAPNAPRIKVLRCRYGSNSISLDGVTIWTM